MEAVDYYLVLNYEVSQDQRGSKEGKINKSLINYQFNRDNKVGQLYFERLPYKCLVSTVSSFET